MASVPPYDLYIFIVLIFLGIGIAACVAKFCCCCCAYKKVEPEEGTGDELKAGSGPSFCVQFLIRWGIGSVIAILGAYLFTLILWAILGASGFGHLLLFSPKVSGECGTSCTYTTKNGLSGWVDETCCTYDERLTGMEDVYIQGEAGEVLHGYLLVNKTLKTIGQKPVTILYSHGSGMNVAAGYRLRKYEYLLSLGNIAIFVYDYHGYGKSTGAAGTATAVSAADRAARWFSNWTAAAWPPVYHNSSSNPAPVTSTSPSLELSKSVLMGESMGGCLTSTIAKSVNYKVNGVLYFATFLHLKRLAEDYWPVAGWAMGGVLNSNYPEYNNEAQINSGSTSVCRYHAHSPDDEWVAYGTHAQQLYSVGLKTSSCSQFVELEAGTIHTQPFTLTQRSTMETWISARRTL